MSFLFEQFLIPCSEFVAAQVLVLLVDDADGGLQCALDEGVAGGIFAGELHLAVFILQEFLEQLLEAMYDELPDKAAPKSRRIK